MLLKGACAIVTGAASRRGIGRTTARRLAEQGARVAILDIDGAGAAAAAAELGEAHIGLRCDVTNAEACWDAVMQVTERLGPVEVLVNNAGITQPRKIMEIDAAAYEAVLDVNLRGTLYMSQAVIPGMRKRGRGAIVCVSSVSAQRGGGIFGGPHYSAAKGGVLGLARAMARELAPAGVRVNAVTPGLIDTDITDGMMTPEIRARILDGIPLGRVGTADDVAGCILFLASDLAAYVTGATLDVNGGMLIH